ncbi:MAG: GGDEF domain-containing protein [Pyrinomonadaceae bacterium]|nr:GGDEF domain-containing protein [Acidobacteriota bacterium]MBP9110912.1 GGDEF domain-containing protein [Pyrinomonadaceae bacterium]
MQMRVLDLYTLSIMLIVMCAALSVAMLVAWRANKTYDGFGWWTAGNLVGASGFVFIVFRGLVPDIIPVVAGNMMSVVGLLVALHGIRIFLGRGGLVYFNVAIVALHFLTSIYYVGVDNNTVMRIACGSVITGAITAMSANEFFVVPKDAKRFVHKFAGWLFLGFSLVMFSRGIVTFAASPIDDLFVPSWIQSLSFVFFNLFAVLWTFTYMVLNSQRLQEDLETAQIELERLATTDYLTGLRNNRAFFERAATEVVRSQRHALPLSLVVFDVDHFKTVNDTFGHPGGDRMLRELAAVCAGMTRQNDMIARLGGEEFGLLLTHADIKAAGHAAENFRVAIEQLIVEYEAENIFVTASFGVAELRQDDTLEGFLARADSCLYQAKNAGRNCVVSESGDIPHSYLESTNFIPPPPTFEHRV